MCFMMRAQGYLNVSGIDYCEASVQLARHIAQSKAIRDAVPEFNQADIFSLKESFPTDWQLILDKGTFDAICLRDEETRSTPLSAQYTKLIAKMLNPSGFFLITSCKTGSLCVADIILIRSLGNWTKSELLRLFSSPGSGEFRPA
jgi:hypothetical protein